MRNKPKRPVVLIVDDEPLLLIFGIDCVECLGFQAVSAPNADVAVSILEHLEDVRGLFTDVSMPGSIDGIDLAKLVRSRWPSVGVLLASGRELCDLPPLPPGSAFLKKPYNLRDLDKGLREVLV